MKRYIIECIGTFFLVLTVALTQNPIAIGVVLMSLVYMGGYISGAQYNPAVTLGLFVSGNISRDDAKKYLASQLLGGFFAAGFFSYITGRFFIPSPSTDISWMQAYIIEMLFTFFLVSVVHHVAVSKKTKGNQYVGLAIGGTLLASAFAAGPLSGGVLNPAVGVSPLVFAIADAPKYVLEILLYASGPLTGGILAGWVYKKLQ